MGLSPLHTNSTNDLHVSTTTVLHLSFVRTSTCLGIDHHLSGPAARVPTCTISHGFCNARNAISNHCVHLTRHKKAVGCLHPGYGIGNRFSHTLQQTPWSVLQDGWIMTKKNLTDAHDVFCVLSWGAGTRRPPSRGRDVRMGHNPLTRAGFTYCLTLFSKFFSSVVRTTLCTIGHQQIFSLGCHTAPVFTQHTQAGLLVFEWPRTDGFVHREGFYLAGLTRFHATLDVRPNARCSKRFPTTLDRSQSAKFKGRALFRSLAATGKISV